ncbi:MAG: hypothetical protein HKN19_15285 [Halioglobus sp.]|nr:hypothetical protein [Halioglobus sp.]
MHRYAAWLRRHWLITLTWVLLILPTVLFLLASLALLLYTYSPRDYGEMVRPDIAPGTVRVTVINHGLRDRLEHWAKPLQEELVAARYDGTALALDWRPFSDSTLRCSVDGLRIGRELGRYLAALPDLDFIHVVGHSCGSFVTLGVCRGVRERRPSLRVQTTYLDPVSIYGGLFWRWGITRFGECADFSEAYIDTGDTVPGSGEPLPNTYTVDVTGARLHSGSPALPHVWPTTYYRRLVRAGIQPDLESDKSLQERRPGGASEAVHTLPGG